MEGSKPGRISVASHNTLTINMLAGKARLMAYRLLKKGVSFLLLALTRRLVGPLFLGAQSPALEGSAGDTLFGEVSADKIRGCHGAPIAII